MKQETLDTHAHSETAVGSAGDMTEKGLEPYLKIFKVMPNYGAKLFQYPQNRIDFLYKLETSRSNISSISLFW